MREFGDCPCQCRDVLRQAITREQLDLRATLVREQADAIKLPFEDPFRSGEALLGKSRGHWLDPFGELWHVQNIEGRRQKAEGEFQFRVQSFEFRVKTERQEADARRHGHSSLIIIRHTMVRRARSKVAIMAKLGLRL